MPIDFPNSPSLNQTFIVGDTTFTWNGQGWVKTTGTQGLIGPTGPTGPSGGPTGPTGPTGATTLTISATAPANTSVIWADTTVAALFGATGPTGPSSGVFDGVILKSVEERWNIVASAATGTIDINAKTASIWYYTTNATANFTLNVRGDSTTTLSSMLAVGDSINIVFLNTNGTTAYYASAFQIDGSAVTPKWQGGVTPLAGNASAVDLYSYIIVKTAATPTYQAFAALTQFK